MATRFELYWAALLESNARTVSFGSLNAPSFESVAFQGLARQEAYTLAAEEQRIIYTYASHGDFEMIALELTSGSVVNVAVEVDGPTSSTDKTPDTNSEHWQMLPNLSATCPLLIPSDDVVTLPNAQASDMVGDNAGYPTAWGDANEEAGYVYQIAVRNPSTTDAVTFRLTQFE